MRSTRAAMAALSLTLFGIAAAVPAMAQAPTVIKGEAILAHPAGKLAIQTAELLAAGKIEESIRLRTAKDQEEWKKESAADRQEMTARMKERAPDPKLLAEAIRKGGVLTVYPARGTDLTRATLESPYGNGGEVMAIFASDKGKWFGSMGPSVMAGAAAPAKEVRITGADILKHPIYELALQYSDAIHSGASEAFLKLTSTKSQDTWKTEPESERKEIVAYYRKTIPKKANLAAGIRSGGILIIEDDSFATLNVVTTESASKEPGVVRSTSTTVGIPFVLEGGQWRVKR
ncbi:MAG TPA: hypothetical protein VE129_01535 [Thermoanaerobaculia bacterium]|nr:hypothetical protein [Thermoanaerobaculia bacterium]